MEAVCGARPPSRTNRLGRKDRRGDHLGERVARPTRQLDFLHASRESCAAESRGPSGSRDLALRGIEPVIVFTMSERLPDDVAATVIERDEVPVMFLRARDELVEIRRGWERLEALVGLRGRKFFGAFDASTEEYRVCVQVREDDDPAALGLESGTLPGGRYLRARLRGEPPEVYERIGPTFAALVKAAPPDEARPSIEFYRHRDEIDLLLPVAEPPAASDLAAG
jgi:hypothetical protein